MYKKEFYCRRYFNKCSDNLKLNEKYSKFNVETLKYKAATKYSITI